MLMNPTISLGSILFLEIGEVKKDYSDVTLSLSNNLLDSFAGDYDGDVLNLIVLFDNILKEAFKLLSPSNLVVDRNDGTFNSSFSFGKDQKLGLYILNNKL